MIDQDYMARAIRLAGRGMYSTHPNPNVGCVIVRDGVVVGEGWHRKAGGPHAEVFALQQAGERARGATVFVTLEPCSHHGRTPPCAQALVAAGVDRVVAAMQDPNPRVGASGLQALRDAGVAVQTGLLEEQARALNPGFISRLQRQRPWVRVKLAASLDGRTAMASGESKWISGPAARLDVQRLRARSSAIVTGIGTVLADDPSLTVRDPDIDTRGRQPLRVVLDNKLRMPLSAEMLALQGETIVYCTNASDRQPLLDAGAAVVRVGGRDGHVDARAVLENLATRGVNEVLVEAGPELAGALITDDLVDELVIYQAPHIMGSETKGMFRTPAWTALSDRRSLDIIDTCRVGPDTRITARFRNQD